jgi:hypothetical protein
MARATFRVAVSSFSFSETVAVCDPPASSIVTAPNAISAACSVIVADGAAIVTAIVSRRGRWPSRGLARTTRCNAPGMTPPGSRCATAE